VWQEKMAAETKWVMEEAIERGCQYLDETAPGWLYLIDLGRLDMESFINCISGQLKLGESGNEELGFCVPYTYQEMDAYKDEFATLTEKWAAKIRQRRQASA
jgi:hypothetical protein